MIKMKSNPLVAGGLMLLAVGLSAQYAGAQSCGICPSGQTTSTVTVSSSFPAGPGFSFSVANNVPLVLPQYNPADHGGAELVGASVRLRARARSSGFALNTSPIDKCSGIWQSNVQTSMSADAALGLPVVGGSGNAIELEVVRTVPFNDLMPGVQLDFPEVENVESQTTCVFDPSLLSGWVGAGDVTLFVSGASAAQFPCSGVGPCLNFDCGVSNSFRLEVDVTYTFCTDLPPPGECPCVGPSPHYRRPGSMLLYPEFDNREGNVTLVTVTNTKCDDADGDVRVEIRFINEDTCGEDDFTRNLTACDTFTFFTKALNPNNKQGYLYIFAKDAQNNPIVWNHLVGSLLVISGLESFDYSVNPVAFRGIGSLGGAEQPDGTLTDLNGNGHLDLDGMEYEPAPDSITIPRFLGQDSVGPEGAPGGLFMSQLILIALSGGQQFVTTVDFCIFNDNEEVFSSEWTFFCWDKPYLTDISNIFGNQWLKDITNHAPDEIFGAPARESGWMVINGAVASSTATDIQDPAFYAVLVERVGSYAAADLPWECGVQFNGSLLPQGL
jgi:hypothetical protein